MLIILFFIIFSSIGSAQTIKYDWKEIKSPTEKPVVIIAGSTPDDLLVFDNLGSFFQLKNEVWQQISIPNKKNYIYYVVSNYLLKEQLIIAMDTDWYAHFFKLTNGIITKQNLIHKNPFNFFTYVDSQTVYAAGSFGSLAKYDGEKFSIINTPIKSHIDRFSVIAKNNYWLGTKSDGIFFYDGNAFSKIDCYDGKNHEILYFNSFGDSLIAITTNNEYLLLKNNAFTHINSPIINRDRSYLQSKNPGFYSYYFEPGNNSSVDIPKSYNPFSLKFFTDKSIVFSTKEGKLYRSKQLESNYFTNLTQYFNINPFINVNLSALSINDFNNDGLPDIFLSYPNLLSEIYYNSNTSILYPKTIQVDSSISKPNGYIHTLGDINEDGYTDIIAGQFKNGKSSIEIFTGDGTDFIKFDELDIKGDLNERYIENLTLTDLDSDGDLDLIVVFYLGAGSKTGSVVFFKNSFWGNFSQMELSDQNKFNGWNKQTISADFNNDGMNDLFLINRWGRNNLFINNNGSFKKETNSLFSDTTKTISNIAAAFDYDNDGDLDLLVASDSPILKLFENNGSALFTDASHKIKHPELTEKYLLSNFNNLCIGDYNNDGFQDVLLILKSNQSNYTYLLINNQAKSFSDEKNIFKLDRYSFNGAVNCDIDNDGDLDLIGYDNFNIRLMINNLDNNNYLKIILHNSHSSSIVPGAKIYIYKSGFMDDTSSLVGFQQVGTFEGSRNHYADITSHFGLSDTCLYDIKVKFYGGNTKKMFSVKTNQTVIIDEENVFSAFIINLPGNIFRFFSSTAIQIYLLCAIVSFSALFVGLRFGSKKLSWDTRSIVLLSATNISAFWIILLVTLDSKNELVKYILPTSVMLVGTIIPLYMSYLIKRNNYDRKDSLNLKEELLQQSINFSHGQWALTNINGIILLLENLPPDFDKNEKIIVQLQKRAETFENLTLPSFHRMVEIASSIENFLSKDE
ncbi:MAG: VCBS repeat-containing protein, partial [Melioribacteraceae bacterium]